MPLGFSKGTCQVARRECGDSGLGYAMFPGWGTLAGPLPNSPEGLEQRPASSGCPSLRSPPAVGARTMSSVTAP